MKAIGKKKSVKTYHLNCFPQYSVVQGPDKLPKVAIVGYEIRHRCDVNRFVNNKWTQLKREMKDASRQDLKAAWDAVRDYILTNDKAYVATVVYDETDGCYGVSKTDIRDNFSRLIGRGKAYSRLLEAQREGRPSVSRGPADIILMAEIDNFLFAEIDEE